MLDYRAFGLSSCRTNDRIPFYICYLQDRKTFFREFFALLSERNDLLRHIHTERCFSIELPKNGEKLEDLQEIKACIASIAQSLPQWKEKIKPKWAKFEHLLKKEIKDKIVSRKE